VLLGFFAVEVRVQGGSGGGGGQLKEPAVFFSAELVVSLCPEKGGLSLRICVENEGENERDSREKGGNMKKKTTPRRGKREISKTE